MDNQQKIYSTRDLNLATTLYTLKNEIIGVDYQIEGIRQTPVGYFNFDDTPEIRDTERKYWRRKLEVEPKQFMNNLRSLKEQISKGYKKSTADKTRFELTMPTRDIDFATTLISLQYELKDIEYKKEGPNNILVGYFDFEDSKELQDTIEQYKKGELMVEPQLYILNYRSLKAQLNNVYKNPHNTL